jgi:hypothetical protein
MNVYYENDVIYSSHSTFHGYCGIPFRAAEVRAAMEKLGLKSEHSMVELVDEGGWVFYHNLTEYPLYEIYKESDVEEISENLKKIKPRDILKWAEPLKWFRIRLTPNLDDSYTLAFNESESKRVSYVVNYIPQVLMHLIEPKQDEGDTRIFNYSFPINDFLAHNTVHWRNRKNICRVNVYFMDNFFCGELVNVEDVNEMINAFRSLIEGYNGDEDWMSSNTDYWFFEVVGNNGPTKIERYEGWKPVDQHLLKTTSEHIMKKAREDVYIYDGFTSIDLSVTLKDLLYSLKRFGFSYDEANNGKVTIDDGGFNTFTIEGGDKELYYPRLKAVLRGENSPIRVALDALELTNDGEMYF